MHANQDDHGGGAEKVHAAHDPALFRLPGDELKAVVRLSGRDDISAGQRDSSYNLYKECHQRSAAENVIPADTRWYRMVDQRPYSANQAGVSIDPGQYLHFAFIPTHLQSGADSSESRRSRFECGSDIGIKAVAEVQPRPFHRCSKRRHDTGRSI